MWRLVFGALLARRGQSAVLFLLAALAVGAATAAPLYAEAAARAVRLHELDTAAAADRAITLRGPLPAGDDLDRIGPVRRQLREAAAGSGLTDLVTLELRGRLGRDGPAVRVTARDDICAHLVMVTGRCARQPGEAVVAAGTHATLEVTAAGLARPLALRVVGTYRIASDGEAYWLGRVDTANPPVFVTAETLLGAEPPRLDTTIDLVALDPATLAADPGPLRAAAAAVRRAAPSGFTVTAPLSDLAGRIEESQEVLRAGVVVSAGQLILICGFVLLLAVGYAAVERRPESGLIRLRGAPARHRFLLTAGPNALVLLAAAPVGFAAGWLATAAVVPVRTTPIAYAVAGGTLLLVLTACVAAEWRTHSGSVLDALRRTPPRRRGWRGDAFDLVVVTLAAAAAYQVGSGTTEGGLAVLTPLLLALACGLLAGRLVLPVAVGLGAARLRRGRLAGALAALHLARRPSAHRLLALVAVAVALLGQAVSGMDTTERAADARARLELGAERVLTVRAETPGAVLAAVHDVDPDGRWAMAAVREQVGLQTVLAVEADRLAQVAYWPEGMAPEMLRPATNPSITVTGTELLLETSGRAVPISARLVRADGTSFDAAFINGRAETPGCSPRGCRLAWFAFPPAPEGVQLHALRQSNPDRVLVDAAGFTSAGRWRPGFNTGQSEVRIRHGADSLSVSYQPSDPRNIASEVRVLVADAPVPMPLIAAGPEEIAQTGEVRHVPGISAGLGSVEVVAVAHGLPGVGGNGYLVDNEYAARLASEPPDRSAQHQVWLAPGAPPTIVDFLGDRLTVVDDETVAERSARLLAQGPGQAARLALLAALIALALAAVGIAVVAGVERERRVSELRALRIQGLPERVAARSGLIGYAGLVVGGVLAGTVAAAVSWAAVRVVVPAFADDWTVTAVPPGPRPLVAILALAGATAVLMGVAALAARPIRRGAA